ncbi:hypothetical protein DQ384_17585 [Sphaerisporangium album]|uniref:Uncharacterized protein n=1 Tax=Sphaerisporangium album TaxID=509200 RepID=A0A367FJG7_9ACTN|nr:hypothetical protein [Sphaerisporangium album]RCG29972.1 hypothetical protein DQ384_17585 [Sphaerisporangium album]
MSREPGRHRVGTPPVQVESRRWDLAKRAAAHQLDQMEPAWFVSYGVGSRRFFAIATWRSPAPLRVEAASVEELREMMREAELGAMARVGGPWAWVA